MILYAADLNSSALVYERTGTSTMGKRTDIPTTTAPTEPPGNHDAKATAGGRNGRDRQSSSGIEKSRP